MLENEITEQEDNFVATHQYNQVKIHPQQNWQPGM